MTKKEKQAYKAKMDAIHAENARKVAKGCCPMCGAGIHRNLSLNGWWQCDRSGSEDFRKDPTGNKCEWQAFTE